MKQQFLVTAYLLISLTGFSQIERSVVIENKVMAVTRTTYYNNDTTKKEVIKNFYSRTGDDSLEYHDGKLAFWFVAKKDANGKVSELARHVKEGVDEIHIYKYNKNGSYSIEILAHGAGRISLATYDKKHLCMEEEIDASYTLVYVRNAHGKTEKILSKEKGNKTETIAQFYFDNNGLPVRGEGTTEGGKTIYFKYNDKKLVSETKTVGKEKGVETTETVLMEYEFYEN